MRTFNFQLTDDLTVPIQANSREEAERILKAEIIKRKLLLFLIKNILITKQVSIFQA